MENSIISWVGGKRLLRKQIIPKIPQHNIYVEVFGGAGWVLFGKSKDKYEYGIKGKDNRVLYTEIYNDFNSELVNFWKYVKHHPDAFTTELNNYIPARELFDDMKETHRRTELERAIKFYYLLDMSFGATMGTFCISKGSNLLPLKKQETVQKASERLKNVAIENLDFERLIKKYDGEHTFFYIDPPYYLKEGLYKHEGIDAFDGHERLAETLKTIKGKFLLSYNDTDFIRNLYKAFKIESVDATYSISGKQQQIGELLISNY